MRWSTKGGCAVLRLLCVVVWAAACGAQVATQSTSLDYPAPVFSNEISGRIAPRDLGDARATRHFYIFNGREGDFTFTVESTDLNGDVDLFTASTLRPLAKVTLYAGASATRVARSVYLQRDEALVLRVEARVAGESEGTYRVSFGGSFAPATTAQGAQSTDIVVPSLSETARRDKSTRRVNSAGATIEEPRTERPPAETAAGDTNASETSTAAAPNSTGGAAASRTTPRTRSPRANRSATGRAGSSRRSTTTSTPSDTSRAEAPAGEASATPTTSTPNARTRRPARRPPARTNRTRPANTSTEESSAGDASAASSTTSGTTPTAGAAVVTATRLVIETKSGERIERDMNGVRRFSVENNQVLIVGRDGKVERVPLANVERMSIEP